MNKKVSFILLSVFTFVAVPAFAATVDSGEHIVVNTTVFDDLYIGGSSVEVRDKIYGDVLTAGGEVTITGTVRDDLTVVGGKLDLSGEVGDDVRAAGGEANITGAINGDLIVFAGRVFVADTAVIGGDIIVNGGEVSLNGIVKGDMKVRGGVISFKGTVNGDADLRSGEFSTSGKIGGNTKLISQSLTLREGATFVGDIEYWVPAGEQDFGASALGATIYNADLSPIQITEKYEEIEWTLYGVLQMLLGAFFAYSILAAALFILIMVLSTKTYFTDAVRHARKKPWKCFGIGVVYFIITPIIATFFLISVIGAPIGLFILAMYAFSLFFAKLMTAMVLARWYAMKNKLKWKKITFFFVSLFAYVALKIIGVIPVVGWLFVAFLILVAFGALVQTEYDKFKQVR